MMAEGLIYNYTVEDEELIEQYNTHNIAMEYGDSLSEVEDWRSYKIEWALTNLKVRDNIAKSKVK